MEEEAKKIGSTSVDIQMIQANLKIMEQVAGEFHDEREKLEVEIKSAPRISVWEPAEEPLIPSNTMSRIALTMLAVLASFCCPGLPSPSGIPAPAASTPQPTCRTGFGCP